MKQERSKKWSKIVCTQNVHTEKRYTFMKRVVTLDDLYYFDKLQEFGINISDVSKKNYIPTDS